MGHTILGEQHGSEDVHVEHHLELFGRDLLHGVQHKDAGVVDEIGWLDFLSFEKMEESISLFY